MATREVEGTPATLPTMLKAALPVLPGAGLVPGVAKRGGDLPDLTLVRRDQPVDRAHVDDYARVCGFARRETLPLTYPHLLAFPLHLAVMTDASFPHPAVGAVHLRNRIAQHRRLTADDLLTVSVTPANQRPHPKGTTFDLVTTVTSEDLVVWESTSTYLRPGRPEGEADAETRPALELVPATGVVWSLPGNLGRRYAAVSGDHNPIHLYPLTAKAFGFRRQIAHGMWTKARCVAALDNRLPDSVTVDVEFKKPVFLPGRVAFGSRVEDARSGEIAFSLSRPDSGAPHLVGRSGQPRR